ncbi:MAG: hypothetical protein JO345_06860 [Streptosporangiaceae bacterium]|nr:hypothetical protein [Streptosporangiaceae bacterium]
MAPGQVLTAAHVVAGAHSIRVLLDAGQDSELDVLAKDWWADPEGERRTDLAVVVIPEEATRDRECGPAAYGMIGDVAAVLPVQVSGFPVFKLRAVRSGEGEPEVFRDFEQASGHTPVAANRRQGTLAIYLDDPAPSTNPPAGSSPWEGMSGAAVWVSGRIVGVLAEHYPAEGTARLTARRIDHAYGQLSRSDLGLLRGLLALPDTRDGLSDVVPAGPRQLARAAYLAQVRDIAPDRLVGRDSELAQWAEFCAGSEQYAWWQAGPWAGKSALASWFVTHPPAGVEVVSFFITGRLIGQADSSAFLDAMIEQLGTLAAPADRASAPEVTARAGAWLSMLELAAAFCGERGRRLVVVVDGLDEDEAGAVPGRGRVSIASLLPRRPPPGTRFIITSRPDPGLPDDVPADHPLRACQPVPLPLSWTARETEALAKQELRDLLSGGQPETDTVGYIAGSGGGLTLTDLAALTGVPATRLESIVRGAFGRSLHARAPAASRNLKPSAADRVYLFGHETLRVMAEDLLGQDLARYRQKVHEWMDSYARTDWPDTTPAYAVRSYPRLLAATDLARLQSLARERTRHGFLFRATGSDHAALAEIRTAQQLLASQDSPELQPVVELAARWYALAGRNHFIPQGLPRAWARLGRFDHAEALARSLPDTFRQSSGLQTVAVAIAEAGDYDRAEAVASTIANSIGADDRGHALRDVAVVIAEAGDYDRAEAVARAITGPDSLAQALTELAVVIAQGGSHDRGAALARAVTAPSDKIRAFTDVAAMIAESGDSELARRLINEAESVARAAVPVNEEAQALADLAAVAAKAGDLHQARRLAERAESIARMMTDPYWRAEMLAAAVTATAVSGDQDLARELAAEAESSARAANPELQDQALHHVADAVTDAGNYDDAELIARTITTAYFQEEALTKLATTIARTGQYDRAEAAARAVSDPDGRDDALTRLSYAIAETGNHDRAEALAGTITDSTKKAGALMRVSYLLAEAGQYDRAEALALAITDPESRGGALQSLAIELAWEAAQYDRAESLARTNDYVSYELDALISVASAIAEAGDRDRAAQLLSEVETRARSLINPHLRKQGLGQIAVAMGQTGDYDRAEEITYAIDGSFERAQALAQIAVAAAGDGDHDRAGQMARKAESLASYARDPSANASVDLAVAIAQSGEQDRAVNFARSSPLEPWAKAKALTGIVAVISQNGDRQRAREVAAEAEDAARTITDPFSKTQALNDIAVIMQQADDRHHVLELAAEAEDAARTITHLHAKVKALADIAVIMHQAGEFRRVLELAAEAEEIARTSADPYLRDRYEALSHAAAVIALSGELDHARDLALTIEDDYWRASALTDIAGKADDHNRAGQIAADAEAAALAISRLPAQAVVLSQLAAVLTQIGDHERAEDIIGAIEDPFTQAQALGQLAVTIAKAGNRRHARELAAAAGEIAGTADQHHYKALVDLATVVEQAGDSPQAVRLLTRALGTDTIDLWWPTIISRSFPEAIGDAPEFLADMYGL